MEGLFARLTEYGASQYYPFHMPGHKRNMPEEIGALQGIAGLDITEIEGFDDLHAPDGILKEAQEKAADIIAQAQMAAKEIRRASHEFSDSILKETEESLSSSLKNVRDTRQALRNATSKSKQQMPKEN